MSEYKVTRKERDKFSSLIPKNVLLKHANDKSFCPEIHLHLGDGITLYTKLHVISNLDFNGDDQQSIHDFPLFDMNKLSREENHFVIRYLNKINRLDLEA